MTLSLVLASASHSRASLLRAAGVDIEICPAAVDEQAVKDVLRAESASLCDQAVALAEAKATKVSRLYSGRLVLGADQILALSGAAFDKPADRIAARAQLLCLRGRPHDLFSAAAIAEDGVVVWRYVSRARLWMREFSDDFLDGYLDRVGGEVVSSVGAYHLEGFGAQLFDRVEGDYFAVLGLPLIETLKYLRARGALQS